MKKLSIVVVNYNAGGYLRRCIKSLYDNINSSLFFEIIVVDNDSKDNSIALLNELHVKNENLFIIKNQDNVGFSRAVNQATAKAEGEFILILNPDCFVFSNTIGKLISLYESDDQIGLIGAALFNEDGTEQRGGRRREPTLWRSLITMAKLEHKLGGVNMHHLSYPQKPIEVEAVSGAAMLIKRELLIHIGGMDEEYFLHCEDLDLCHVIRNAGYKIMYASDALVMHRQGVSGQGINYKVEKYKHAGMLYYYNKHYAKSRLARFIMQSLIKVRLLLLNFRETKHVARKENLAVPAEAVERFNEHKPKIIVTGGRSDIGDSLVSVLANSEVTQNVQIIYISRRPLNSDQINLAHVQWLHLDFVKLLTANDIGTVLAWINLAPIWTSEIFAQVLTKFSPQRVIAVSSTSILTKANSSDIEERRMVEKLKFGEQFLSAYAANIPAFILRPTMIYGGRRNRNVNVIKAIVKLTRLFPIVGDGSALRQPVHCEDVAYACKALLTMSAENGVHSYNLPGNEKLTYKQLVERVFSSFGYKARFIPLPLSVARFLLKCLGWLPGMRMISSQAANRMEQDLSFSVEQAQRDFNYQPRDFKP